MKQQPVILFDGVCNFCNSTINFIIKNDKKAKLLFAPIQSAKGRLFLKQFNLPENDLTSFLLIEDGKVYNRSTAALRISRYLKGAWPLFYGFVIIPKFIRDAVYNLIAKNRYKWFGMRRECMIPTPEIRGRFIE
jgi:predicted DCC family thiol-disulfide oxidoreductase YuxK